MMLLKIVALVAVALVALVEIRLALTVGALANGTDVLVWRIAGTEVPLSILGATFALMAVAKIVVAAVAVENWQTGKRWVASGFGLLWVTFATGMVVTELSYASAIRAQRVVDAAHVNSSAVHRRQEIDAELKAIASERGGLGFTVKSVAEIDEDLAAKRRDRRFVSEKNCEVIESRSSRELCHDVRQLQGRQVSALERDSKIAALDARKPKLEAERANLPKPAVSADALFQFIGTVMAVTDNSASLVWAAAMAILLQLTEVALIAVAHRQHVTPVVKERPATSVAECSSISMALPSVAETAKIDVSNLPVPIMKRRSRPRRTKGQPVIDFKARHAAKRPALRLVSSSSSGRQGTMVQLMDDGPVNGPVDLGNRPVDDVNALIKNSFAGRLNGSVDHPANHPVDRPVNGPADDAALSNFVAATIVQSPGTMLPANEILSRYQGWTEVQGRNVQSQKALGRAMTDAGFQRTKFNGVIQYTNAAFKELGRS